MHRWLTVVILVLLVLTAAVGIRNMVANSTVAGGAAPVPPTPWMMAGGAAPVPPTPWMGGAAPVPPTPWTR
jgi:hypothetical protein